MARKKRESVTVPVPVVEPIAIPSEPLAVIEPESVVPVQVESEPVVDSLPKEPKKRKPRKVQKRVYSIRLYSVPSADIEAETAEEAFELYKQKFGILATDHRPDIRETEVEVDDQ